MCVCVSVCVYVCILSSVLLFVTRRTVACQAPLSMGFPPLTPSGDLPVAPAL